MESQLKISGKRVTLRELNEQDVSQDYIAWMNDSDILQYLTSKNGGYDEKELKEYVHRIEKSKNDHLLGIFLNEGNKHIGNIKVGNIDTVHKFADVGLLIGNKNEYGKGYGSEAIALVTQLAFDQLGLNKLVAGMIVENIGSYKAFVKAGYVHAGTLKKHVYYNGQYSDSIIMELCNDKKPDLGYERITVGQDIC